MVWDSIKNFAQGLGMAVQGMFAPSTVLAITQRQNEIDRIASQFELERSRQELQLGLQASQQQFQAALETVRQKYSREMEEYRQYREDIRLQKRLDSEREQLTRRFQHEQQLEQYRRETQIILAHFQLTSTLIVADRQEIRDKFPLKTPAKVLLEFYNQFQGSDRPIPLLVIISPPGLEFEKFPNAANGFSRIESRLVDGVGEFCKHYPLNSAERPIKYQGADWNSKVSHGQSAIDILHYVLKAIPTAILESKVDGDLLKIYVAGWDMMEEIPHYQKVLTIPWKVVLYPIARKYAQQWREYRITLLEKGRSLEDVKRRGGDDELNLLILEEEEEDREFGFARERDYSYNIREAKYIQDLSDVLEICHCILVGIVADRYHFSHADIRPKLPELLPTLLAKIPSEDLQHLLLEEVVFSYQSIYESVKKDRSHLVPDLLLDLALSFSHLSDPSWAKRQIENALKCWLNLRKIEPPQDLQALLTSVEAALLLADADYVEKLNRCLTAIGESHFLDVMQACYNRGVSCYQEGEYQAAIVDFDAILQVNPQWAEAYYHRGLAYAKLNQHHNALENYNQALKLNDQWVVVYNNRANAYYKIGQYKAAIADYDAALSLNPDNVSANRNRDLVWGVWQEIKRKLENASVARTLTGHINYVRSLAISPDGQTLVSGSNDKTIKVWQLNTGQELRTLSGHSAYVNCLAISPDGQTLVSGSEDRTIKVWQLNTGQELRTLSGHSDYVNCLAISPDGQTLVSGSDDKTIKVWQLNTGQKLRTLSGHSAYVRSLTISPDGQTLVSGSDDGTIKVWQLNTGQKLRTLTGHSGSVNAFAVSRRTSISSLSYIHVPFLPKTNALAISPDGQTLVSGSNDKTIKVWQLNTGQELRTLSGHSDYVNCLAISPDGQTLVSGSDDKTIKVWQVQQ